MTIISIVDAIKKLFTSICFTYVSYRRKHLNSRGCSVFNISLYSEYTKHTFIRRYNGVCLNEWLWNTYLQTQEHVYYPMLNVVFCFNIVYIIIIMLKLQFKVCFATKHIWCMPLCFVHHIARICKDTRHMKWHYGMAHTTMFCIVY